MVASCRSPVTFVSVMVTKANGGSLISNSIAEATMVPMRLANLRARAGSLISALRASAHRPLGPLFLDQLIGLDDVAFLDVRVRQRQTAFVAVADLGDIVLLATQRRHGEVLRDNDVVTQQPRLGVAANDARLDEATR